MNIFQMKTKPHGMERFQQFWDEGFICIGWPGLGNLENVTKDELSERISSTYGSSGHKLGNALGQINSFINTMQNGDIVIVCERDTAYFATVGEYKYVSDFDNESDGMCHRRSVQWLGKLPIKNLNASVQKLLANRNVICKYPNSYEESGLDQMFPTLPPVHKQDRTRFDKLFEEALTILEEELKSDDSDRRLKAATELIRLKRGV